VSEFWGLVQADESAVQVGVATKGLDFSVPSVGANPASRSELDRSGAQGAAASPVGFGTGQEVTGGPAGGTATGRQSDLNSTGAEVSSCVRDTSGENSSGFTLPSSGDDSLPASVNASVIGDELESFLPNPHGQDRNLQLAPPSSAVGASNTIISNTASSSTPTVSDIEFPSLNVQAGLTGPTLAQPFIPPIQPATNGSKATPSSGLAAVSSEPSSAGTNSAESPSSQSARSANDTATGRGIGTAALTGGGASSPSSPAVGVSAFKQPGKNCSPDGPPGLSGGGGQAGIDPTSSPPGPPCRPPGHQNSSVQDPLFVLNWNDGLVMFPGVVEFDSPGDSVDLRAQVYGATVASYSWDLTQAPNAGCPVELDGYRVRFAWSSNGDGAGVINQISVTATMTDQTTQSMTLTFNVAPGQAAPCQVYGIGSSAVWPTVLTPDTLQGVGSGDSGVGEAAIASDSATRPYAVSAASGGLFASHLLPAYNPGVAPLALNYSSLAAEPEPIFIERYEISPTGGIPDTVSARLRFDGAWGPSKHYRTGAPVYFNPGSILQISLQDDGGNRPTGRYDYTVEVTAHYATGDVTTSTSGQVTIVNEETSPFGEGWTLQAVGAVASSLQSQASSLFNRLHIATGGVILNQGAGHSLWYASSGPNTFTTPAGDFSTLVKNGDGTFTRTLKDGTKQNFSTTGLQASIVDRNNNTITFAYDGSNNLATITDQNNLVTTFSYSGSCGAAGRVCTITDPAGRVTTLAYDASGRLTSVTDPDNAVWPFTYDASSGRMTTMKDPRNNTTTFAYNFAGRVATITRPDSTSEQFTALQLQSLCSVGQCTAGQPGLPLLAAEAVADYTDLRANAWDYRLDWRGFGTTTQITDPLGQSEPVGHMTVMHRDTNGLESMFTDRLDRNSFFDRDAQGNITKLTHPDLKTRLYQYNSNSQVTQATDELGRVTTSTYDAAWNLTQITQPDPDGPGGPLSSPITSMTYDSQGRMTARTNARNYATNFTFDSRDRVTEIKYPDGDSDPNNNPKITLGYDAASNLTSRTDERNYTTSFTHDGVGRVLTVTTPDRDGAGPLPAPVTTFLFDASGNLTQVTDPDPDGAGPLTAPVSTNSYNSMNRRATASDALNNTTSFGYDNVGHVTTVTDPLSRTTSYTYSELSHLTTVTEPDPDGAGPLTSPVTTFVHDAEGQRTSVTDPINRVTTNTWNSRGWVSSQTDPLNNTWTFGYDAVGNRTAEDDPLGVGSDQNFVYDDLNRVISFTDPLDHTTTLGYDAVGNRTSVTDPLGHTSSNAFDPRDRLVSVTQPDPDGGGPLSAPVTTFTFDAASNRTGITDPLGRTTTYTFDPANRLTSITQPDPDGGGALGNPVTTFGYDNLDRMKSLTDPVGNVTSWTYDAIDQVLSEIDPMGKLTTFTHDAAGQLTRIVDRKAQRREFVYDNDGRRTQENWCTTASGPCTASRTFAYTYDNADQLTDVTEPDSHYSFTYDAAGRVATISSLGSNMPQITLTNTYDAVGNRTRLTDNLSSSGAIDFAYDAAYRMTSAAMTVGSDFGPKVDFGYDTANRLTSLTRSIPVCELCRPDNRRINSSFSYDNADRTTGITHTFTDGGPPTTLASYTYAYNAASELTSETNGDGSFTYSYDATSQLTGVDGPNAPSGPCLNNACDETFAYDLNGNRTSSTGYGLSQTYTTGTSNRLTSDDIYNYTYDDNGNLTLKSQISNGQRFEYTWDFRNRLTNVVQKNTAGTILQQSDYTYDAFDRRIIQSFDDDGPGSHVAVVTKTMYNVAQPPSADQIARGTTPLQPDGTYGSAILAANPYADFDGHNALTMLYLYGPAVDLILARRNASGTVNWYLSDHLGTVRDLVDTSGMVIDHLTYSAYGKVAAEANSSNGDRFKFTGRELDTHTGSYFLRARHYSPDWGRFISEDPVSYEAGDENLLRYASNNPITITDPTGLGRWVKITFWTADGIEEHWVWVPDPEDNGHFPKKPPFNGPGRPPINGHKVPIPPSPPPPPTPVPWGSLCKLGVIGLSCAATFGLFYLIEPHVPPPPPPKPTPATPMVPPRKRTPRSDPGD